MATYDFDIGGITNENLQILTDDIACGISRLSFAPKVMEYTDSTAGTLNFHYTVHKFDSTGAGVVLALPLANTWRAYRSPIFLLTHHTGSNLVTLVSSGSDTINGKDVSGGTLIVLKVQGKYIAWTDGVDQWFIHRLGELPSSSGTTAQFLRGDETWSNALLGNLGVGAAPTQRLDVTGTSTVYARVASTTTGAANEGGLILERGDQANGYAQVTHRTGSTALWQVGVRAGSTTYNVLDAVTGGIPIIVGHNAAGRTMFTAQSDLFALGVRYNSSAGPVYYGPRVNSADPGFQISNASGTAILSGTAAGDISVPALLDVSAAAAGQIKFPATQNPSSDANTLDDYLEGSGSGNLGSTAGALTTATFAHTYVKVGKQVTISGRAVITTNGTGAGGIVLPLVKDGGGTQFTAVEYGAFVGKNVTTGKTVVGEMPPGGGNVILHYYDGTYPAASGETINYTGTIFV